MSKKKSYTQNKEWVTELIEAAEAVVIGYEKYLKDELNHLELARIMKVLRSYLPIGISEIKKENDDAV